MIATQNSLEMLTRAAWHLWGNGYSLHTACSRCGQVRHCRGKTREGVICLECWDLKGGRR